MVQKKFKKIKVAFIIPNNPNWLGEFNYFKSLIGSINELKVDIPIELHVFTGQEEKNFIQKKYNKVSIIKTSFLNDNGFMPFIKKLSSYFFGKYDPIMFCLLKKHSINIISHYRPLVGFKNISWFPDFQHIHYPKFFSKKEIISRNKLYNGYIKNSETLIVSSNSSKRDLVKFKKRKKEKKNHIEILNFIPEINFSKIRSKKSFIKEMNIKDNYIFTPNQFWVHKNHICIIEALKILKDKGLEIKCIFTGSNYDHRKPNHFNDLIKKIKLYKLNNQIKYLGILPYHKIINLLYHSKAVINPSYFEGWSTVVEEVKILDKKIVLSNIDVHLEQKPNNGVYFNPENPKELANRIENIFRNKEKINKDLNKLKYIYQYNRDLFAQKYIDIIMSLKN